MRWCRCPNCAHKMFMYDPDEKSGKVIMNIKCSSCKHIADIVIMNGKVKAKIYESETR